MSFFSLARRTLLYLTFLATLAGTCDRQALLNDYMIAEKVSALGNEIPAYDGNNPSY